MHGTENLKLCCSVVICVVRLLFVLFGCYLCCSVYCLCVNVYCHRVTTQLQLTNISYHIISYQFYSKSSPSLSFIVSECSLESSQELITFLFSEHYSFHAFPSYFLKIHFNITLPSAPRYDNHKTQIKDTLRTKFIGDSIFY
jgi:hypothetical protein